MAFTSLKYLLFFTVVVVVFFLLPKKSKNFWLLLCSYYFYMCWNIKYALLMLFSTFITYLSGLLINKSKSKREKKILVVASIVINLAILILFKYYSFIIDCLNPLLNIFSLEIPKTLNLILPVGISFYTFQALSYTIDVYRDDVKVERNFVNYALFVSFFPQLVAGPIEKAKDLLGQFSEEHKFNWDKFHEGIFLIAIGFFYKLVISDRAALIVDHVYNDVGKYTNGGGLYFILATFVFAFQIYFDFNAYSTIAKGSAKVMGFELSTNFKKPYLATSIRDFWKRWNISLCSWFKEYLYFPLGGSRKGFLRTQINILIVFLVSGLWHGAALKFIIWGVLHGAYQVIENIISKYRKKDNRQSITSKMFNWFITFSLVAFASIFFRANNLNDSLSIITNLFSFGMKNKLELLGTSWLELIILLSAIIIVMAIEIYSEAKNIKELFYKQNIVIRWIFYYILIFSIIIFGVYGPGFSAQEFIYFQF